MLGHFGTENYTSEINSFCLIFWVQNVLILKIIISPRGQNVVISPSYILLTKTNSKTQNSMVVFIFSVFNWKYSFQANVVPKIKNVCGRWNLITRRIWICRIHWWCVLILFSSRNTLFAEFGHKNLIQFVRSKTWYLD